jgi:hypothetical protein
MFWWGKFFSCTLHLSGSSKAKFKVGIQNSYYRLQPYYISISEHQWAHHLEEPDYRKIGSMDKLQFDECCDNFNHTKIASSHSLTEWEKAPIELFENWNLYLSLCGLIP